MVELPLFLASSWTPLGECDKYKRFLLCRKERPGTEGQDQFENSEFTRLDSRTNFLSAYAIGQPGNGPPNRKDDSLRSQGQGAARASSLQARGHHHLGGWGDLKIP